MPSDTDNTIPVLIHINPDDWREFKRLAGRRRASMKVRALIRRHNAAVKNAVKAPSTK